MPLHYTSNPAWTHAGGVVCRGGRHAPEILLVRAKPAPHDWVLPKGHLEPGETPHECARREVREEAGVDAEPIAFAGEDTFTTPAGKRVHAAFFVLTFVNAVPAGEKREVRWCSLTEALELLRFDGKLVCIRRLAAPKFFADNPEIGIKELYEARFVPLDESPLTPISIVFLDLPEALAAVRQPCRMIFRRCPSTTHLFPTLLRRSTCPTSGIRCAA